jgi:hypothetical protein
VSENASLCMLGEQFVYAGRGTERMREQGMDG